MLQQISTWITLHHSLIFVTLVIFFLNAFGAAISNLKSVYLSKKVMAPVYLTTFLDALLASYALKLIANSSGPAGIVAFACGRLLGVWLGDMIEEKVALGIIELTINKHMEDGVVLADELREKGYSVTTFKGYGINGSERMILNVIAPRKAWPGLSKLLKNEGKLNMAIKNVNKTYGKVGLFS